MKAKLIRQGIEKPKFYKELPAPDAARSTVKRRMTMTGMGFAKQAAAGPMADQGMSSKGFMNKGNEISLGGDPAIKKLKDDIAMKET